ncbi:MAG: DUF2628 domain-containing protein [Pseudomonadota bacterium]
MEKVKHELQLNGTIQEGSSLVTAVEKLTKLFKDKAEWFQPLLDGQPVSRTLYITPENAEKLQSFLATIGLKGQVMPHVATAAASADKSSSRMELEDLQSDDAPVDLVAMAGMDVSAAATQHDTFPDTLAENASAIKSTTVKQQANSGELTLQLEPVDEEAADQAVSAANTDHVTVCPKCGVEQEPAEQCSACGIFFTKYRAQQEGSTVTEPAGTTTDTDSTAERSTLDEDMLDYVRENGYYYDGKFDAFRDAGDKFKPGWHWPGFFFPFHWALYRKLWLWAAALFVIPVILAPALPFFSLIFINALFAMSANFIYYKHVRNEVTRLRKRRKATTEILAKTGGTSWPAVVAGLILPLVFSGALMSWMMPNGIEKFQEMQSSYDAQDPKLMKTRQGQETFLNMTMAKLAIVVTIQQGKIKPHEVSYDRLVDEGMPANNLIDGWGTPFRINAEGSEVFIASAGPDKEFDTSDDLKQ